jgi:hypothetical protein
MTASPPSHFFTSSNLAALHTQRRRTGMDDTQALLLPQSDGVVPGVVDFRGGPASRASTGRWSAAMFVLGTASPRNVLVKSIDDW